MLSTTSRFPSLLHLSHYSSLSSLQAYVTHNEVVIAMELMKGGSLTDCLGFVDLVSINKIYDDKLIWFYG